MTDCLVGLVTVPLFVNDRAENFSFILKEAGAHAVKVEGPMYELTEALTERGIPVAITAGANASIVAEHTVMMMLATYKRLPLVDRNLRQGNWMKTPSRAFSFQMKGKTVGIVGLGNIGKEVARRARASTPPPGASLP